MSKPSDYEILQYLGSGTFGTCSKVCLRSDRSIQYAWKDIDYSQFTDAELQMLCREVNVLRTLEHASVVRFHGRIVDVSSKRLLVLMEYCSNGDLSSLIACFAGVNRLLPQRLVPEAFVRRVCAQLLSALDYCHSRNVIHRDLKPANVLLDSEWNAKLADFGLSRVLSSMQSMATTFVGTPMYMSPELLGDMDDGFSTPKSDVWALGCVLHELMALKAPFSARTKPELRSQIRNGCHTELPVVFSPTLRRLAVEMLRTDLAQRPSAAQLLARPEVRLWSGAGAVGNPWSADAAGAVGADGAFRVGSDSSGGATERQRAELMLLQSRLANKEAELSKREAELNERDRRLVDSQRTVQQTEARLQSWETRLVELHRTLCEKQQLLADRKCQPGTTGLGTRSRRQGPEEQPQKPRQRSRIALQSIDLSPIVAQDQQMQMQQSHQQLLVDRGAGLLKEAKRLTADGKYSPVTPPSELPQQQQQQEQQKPQQQQQQKKAKKQTGTYEPILGVATRRQKLLKQLCSPVELQ